MKVQEQFAAYKTEPKQPKRFALDQLDMNGIAAVLMFAAERKQGIIAGGPEIDEKRCNELLALANKIGLEIDPDKVEKILSMLESLDGVRRL
jgi:hypothetical protein